MRKRLEKGQRFRRHLAEVRQIVGVADGRELGELFFLRQACHIVHFFRAGDVAANSVGERRLGKEIRPRRHVRAGEQAVLAECFLVEKRRGT